MTPQPHIRLATIDGELARDEGMARALAAEKAAWRQAWRDIVYNVCYVPIGWEGLGEDLKHICFEAGLPQPRKPGSWGAMVMAAKRKGALEHTGAWGWPLDEPSHASAKQILRRTGLV